MDVYKRMDGMSVHKTSHPGRLGVRLGEYGAHGMEQSGTDTSLLKSENSRLCTDSCFFLAIQRVGEYLLHALTVT